MSTETVEHYDSPNCDCVTRHEYDDALKEIRELDLDLSAVWEHYGEPGVSLAEGLKCLGRPDVVERCAPSVIRPA